MTKTHSMKIALMLSGVALIALTKGAQAGFEWKGPLEPPPSLPAAEAPAADDGMSDLAPVTGDVPPALAPVAPAHHGIPAQEEAVLAPMPAPVSAPVSAPAATQGGDVLAGFGADLPLVIALQQVVPPGYQYSFSGNVNPGALVSWEGGRPWQHVLGDMLARQGLGYKLHENTVIISYHAGAGIQQSATQAPAPSSMQAEGTDDIPAPIDGTQPMSITQAPAAQPAPVVAQTPAAEERVDVRRKKKSFWKKLAWWQKADEPAAQQNDDSSERTASETKTATYWGTEETAHWRNEPATDDRTAGGATPAYRGDRLISHPPAPTPKSDDGMSMSAPGTSMSSSPALTEPPAAMAPVQKSWPEDKAVSADPAPAVSASAAMAASADGETGSSKPVQVASAQTTAAPDAVAATDSGSGNWQGGKGQTLRDVLKSWADKAGVELYWSIDYDYRLTDSVGYPGSFDEAVGRLLDKFAAVRPQPYGQLHQGSAGPRVLVIKSYDLAQ